MLDIPTPEPSGLYRDRVASLLSDATLASPEVLKSVDDLITSIRRLTFAGAMPSPAPTQDEKSRLRESLLRQRENLIKSLADNLAMEKLLSDPVPSVPSV